MMPVMSVRLLDAIELSSRVTSVFAEKSIRGIIADRARCEEMVERSLAMATALAPLIGYSNAARIAQEALATGQTIRSLMEQRNLLPKGKLDKILDPWSMTEPGIPGNSSV
jgi:fumarate hydratase class II